MIPDQFFSWPAPTDPSTPFVGQFLFIDSIRVIIVLLCIVIATLGVSAASRPDLLPGLRARLLGSSMAFFVYVGLTEITHLGDYANWRLYAGLISAMMFAWGLWSHYHFEDPPRFRERKEV